MLIQTDTISHQEDESMDAVLFAKMLSDKSITDLHKMQHKYSAAEVTELISLLTESIFKVLPLRDFSGASLVYMENVAQVRMSAYKTLLSPQNAAGTYGLKAMEDEIHSTLTIENINSSRDSIRRILSGYAPKDEEENRIYGMKHGLEFIGDSANKITEESIFKLYTLTVGDFLDDDDKLLPGNYYRHDNVYVVGSNVEHQGLPHTKLPQYMKVLIAFVSADDKMNDLLKAAAIHFYIAYLHPYFDGNGRMARLIHLWYLVQQGYPAALFVPFSSYIGTTKGGYYKACTQAEDNTKISGLMDITPFLVYFIENVYNKIQCATAQNDTIKIYQKALVNGKITEKEKDLFQFVLSAYGDGEFSTKQLEKDFGNAAYATIRGFVLKFEKLGVLAGQKYGNRVKYRVVR